MTERSSVPRLVHLALAAVAACALSLSAAVADAAAITINGTVRCPSGTPVVGVWVQSSGGGSGFADRRAYPTNPSISGYKAAVNPGKVELHVGCGGEESDWDSDQWTPGFTVSASRKLNATCKGPAGTFKRRTCAFPARPKLEDPGINTFDEGFCTWYAADRWRKATRKYPTWSGNAWEWDDNAEDQGWTVTKAPAPRSVVVFEPGVQRASGLGHVAWVESISYRSNGWYLNVKEMNFPTFDVVSSRSVKHVPKMRYIWAPN
ncbi:MAG TPA: CHAP domain-containing protein [Solirubrobacterales bacterium]|nr:CHAP domain-containing protein [Solirubrobacterales bacterium]